MDSIEKSKHMPAIYKTIAQSEDCIFIDLNKIAKVSEADGLHYKAEEHQKIAQLEHFRLAANELNISQPSLSRSMDTLENELGIPLFEKNGRNITLTKYGKMFLEHVDRILEEVRTAEQKMYHLTQEGGHIDIA